MNRDEIVKICKRVNRGENLKEICNELNVEVEQIERDIKSYGIKKSSVLECYYNKEKEEEIKKLELEVKCVKNMDIIENLWLKRYRGIDVNIYEDVIDENEEWADEPREEIKIDLNYELLSEIEDIAKEEGTDLSLYIEKMLLQMLERNKETRMHTKGRKKYIESMIDGSICEEHKDEVLRNINSPNFVKFKDLTYKSKFNDVKIYVANYLMNNGYTLEQVEEVAKDVHSDLYDKNYCSEDLEAHYDLIHSKEYTTFEEVKKALSED